MGRKRNTEQNFWNRVNIRSKDECWLWQASTTKEGYGQFTLNFKSDLAHRWSYRFLIDEIPNHLELLHKCHNKLCVNPNHLVLGTRFQNRQDSDVAVLDWNKVRSIREKYATGRYTLKELAKEFKVTFAHIGRIVRKVVWIE